MRHIKWTAELIGAWTQAALADGWQQSPISANESVEEGYKLEKEGWLALVRVQSSWAFYHLRVWGPDGLAVVTPKQYNMSNLRAGLRICLNCRRMDVDTEQVGFANRCCAECAPKLRSILEEGNWAS